MDGAHTLGQARKVSLYRGLIAVRCFAGVYLDRRTSDNWHFYRLDGNSYDDLDRNYV